MRIAQISGPWLAVPPAGYGGSETMVAHLADGLVERGHEVTLFAPPNSVTRARLHSFYDQELGLRALVEHSMLQIPALLDAYSHHAEFDVVHDHTFPTGPMIGFHIPRLPIVHTMHGAPQYGDSLPTYQMLSRRVRMVAISDSQRRSAPAVQVAATIPNGIDLARFPYRPRKQDYLLFVGRICPEKGVDLAIEVAEAAGRELRIAAKLREPAELDYFAEVVQPRLSPSISYLGEVGHAERVELFGNAAATLATGRWDEPFGLAMVESLACGTPVLATDRGAATEIVEHGVTGFRSNDTAELARLAGRIGELAPEDCRRAATERFSHHRMVADYEALYLRELERA